MMLKEWLLLSIPFAAICWEGKISFLKYIYLDCGSQAAVFLGSFFATNFVPGALKSTSS